MKGSYVTSRLRASTSTSVRGSSLRDWFQFLWRKPLIESKEVNDSELLLLFCKVDFEYCVFIIWVPGTVKHNETSYLSVIMGMSKSSCYLPFFM